MGQVASTRACRLLAASASAYGIDATGGFTPPQPYFGAVGFVDPPTVIVGGVDHSSACLIGTNHDDGVIVAFRGTFAPRFHDLPGMLDWIQDFEAIPISVPGIPGMVHQGIWDELGTLWSEVEKAVEVRLRASGGAAPINITGHSKGGGMAHLAAMRLSLAGLPLHEVLTFAAPRIGDQAFADAYHRTVSATRYENADDLAPHLPPDPLLLATLSQFPMIGPRFRDLRPWIYVSVGNLKFIDWNASLVGDSDQVRAERLAHLALMIIRLRFDEIAGNHRSDCGFGYMSAICSGVCSEPDLARESAALRN
jgi:hypothetical protein